MNEPQTRQTDARAERGLVEGMLYYLSILMRYRWMIIITTGTAAVGIVIFLVLTIKLPAETSPLPTQYTAEAVLILQEQGSDMASSIMSALGVSQASSGSVVGSDTGSMILAVLHSRPLLDTVIAEFNLVEHFGITNAVKGKSRQALLSKLGIEFVRETGTLAISFTDPDPVLCRDIVNRVVALLEEWFDLNTGTSKSQQLKLLEEKVTEVKSSIAGLEYRLKQLQNRYGVLTAADLGATQASALADLRSQLILKEIEIKNYSSFSLVDDARLQQLKAERQNIQDLISQLQGGIPSTSGSGSTPGGDKSLADVAQQFSQLSNELDIQRRIYNLLSPQYEAAKLTRESQPAFQVLELAEIPDTKSGPERGKIAMIVVVGAFVLSIAAALFINAIGRMKPRPGKESRA
jgi:tyrosine-protein kinase Etk/Wzc